tara:strand:+ start:471 stop:638 length:168 start_codon:yes stop_codon:yes gene_type:complete
VEAKSKEIKKVVKKEEKKSNKYKILKANNGVIFRENLSDAEIKSYEAKGCKVEVD